MTTERRAYTPRLTLKISTAEDRANTEAAFEKKPNLDFK